MIKALCIQEFLNQLAKFSLGLPSLPVNVCTFTTYDIQLCTLLWRLETLTILSESMAITMINHYKPILGQNQSSLSTMINHHLAIIHLPCFATTNHPQWPPSPPGRAPGPSAGTRDRKFGRVDCQPWRGKAALPWCALSSWSSWWLMVVGGG